MLPESFAQGCNPAIEDGAALFLLRLLKIAALEQRGYIARVDSAGIGAVVKLIALASHGSTQDNRPALNEFQAGARRCRKTIRSLRSFLLRECAILSTAAHAILLYSLPAKGSNSAGSSFSSLFWLRYSSDAAPESASHTTMRLVTPCTT